MKSAPATLSFLVLGRPLNFNESPTLNEASTHWYRSYAKEQFFDLQNSKHAALISIIREWYVVALFLITALYSR